ncbi:MAG: hypothetical protein AUK44_01610 [Porphyromonadaceae bacterium CG2_30_38_12]|nr:MAG: hypothetical protein AUK44_01610 [Porphyromonadaceae bacterium CG2_30_38_12]
MKATYHILIFFVLLLQVAKAEANRSDSLVSKTDSAFAKTETKTFKPDPARVVWMGAIIPGFGQILNRRYWKVPIVYAGFVGCAYLISFNSARYEKYKLAYKDISDTNDNTASYLKLLPEGYSVENYPGGVSGLEANLKSFYEQTRRNRDLSVIVSVAYYAVTLIEAYVDAQLFDFDISSDLSLHLQPALLKNNFGTPNTAGVQISLKLK